MQPGFGFICQQHLEFMKWADAMYWVALSQLPAGKAEEDLGTSFQSLFGTLTHIYKAELLWFRRVQGDSYPKLADIEIPEHDGMLEHLWTGLHQAWLDWAAGVSEDGWSAMLKTRTMQGVEYQLPLWQVVLHVVNHGSYHRGQLATMLRQSGVVPPATDLVAFYRTRSGLINL